MINPDIKIKEFERFYAETLEFYTSALNYFIELIHPIQCVEQVSGRIKSYEECLKKFESKYHSQVDPDNTHYRIFDYLTDFIGIRIVCLYLKDVALVRKELRKNFSEINISDKSVQLEGSEDKFGYKSLHLDLQLKKKTTLPGLQKYQNIRFEVQIRTVLQDAWGVLDHRIKYKRSIPKQLKRRINRLSALFELADEEFLRIKEEIALEEKRISKRLKTGDKLEKYKPLDAFSFLFIALKHFPDYNFVDFKVDGFVQEILNCKSDFTESDLYNALHAYLKTADRIALKEKISWNPYMKISCCLYYFNPDAFSGIFSAHQRHTITHR